MGQGRAFVAEGQMYTSSHIQGSEPGQKLQGEKSEYREMRGKELVGTNHGELTRIFPNSLDFIPCLEGGWEIEQGEGKESL